MEVIDSLLHHAQRISHQLKTHQITSSQRFRWLLGGFVLLAVVGQLLMVFEVDTASTISSFASKIPVSITFGSKGAEYDVEEDPGIVAAGPSLEELLEMPLYERLLAAFPYDRSRPFDKNIIQTNKRKDSTNKEIEKWKSNQDDGFEYTMYDDQMAYRLLLQEFGRGFPEIIEAYNLFPRVILRVDFFRYASLFLRGGTYSDTDTDPNKPLKDWITFNDTIYDMPNTVGAVFGIETDCDCQDWERIYSSRVQMCQWTLQAKKHHPMYAMLVSNIVNLMKHSYNPLTKVLSYKSREYDFSPNGDGFYDGILHLTGPGMFSDTTFQYINTIANVTSINPNDQEATFKNLRVPTPGLMTNSNREPEWSQFGWENVTRITQPVLVDNDVLILPEQYFNGKKDKHEVCLVEHLFHGSWKGAGSGIVNDN